MDASLDTREAEWPEAVAAVCLLALTGCQRSEMRHLRRRDIRAEAVQRDKFGPIIEYTPSLASDTKDFSCRFVCYLCTNP